MILLDASSLLCFTDSLVVCILARGSDSDWQPSLFRWDESVFDVIVLAILRGIFGLVFLLSRAKSHCLIVFASILCISSAVYSVVKLSAAHTLVHERPHALVVSTWLACFFAMGESILFGIVAVSSAGREQRRSISNDGEDGLESTDVEENGMHYERMREKGREQDRHFGEGTSVARVLALAWPERYLLAVALFCLLVASATQMMVPTLFGKLIQTISKTKSEEELDRTVATMLVVFTVSSIFAMFRGALFNLAGERLVARFRVRVFEAVVSQDVAFFDVSQSGELQSRLSNDTTKIQDAVTVNVSMGLRWLAQVVVGLLIIFAISWKLTLIMLSVVPGLAIGARYFGMYIRSLSTKYQESLARGGEVAEQAFSCIRTVRSFSKESHEVERYRVRISESYSYGVKMAWAYGAFLGGIGLLAYFAIALVLWYGGRLVIRDTSGLDAAKLTSFLLYTIYIAVALGGLSGLYSQIMSAVGASERMFELIDRVPTVPTDKTSGEEDDVELDTSDVVGRVDFEHVSFSYPSRQDISVLEDISFTCEPGQIHALVGSSGGGKSTIINLLMRFYDPIAGRVLVDGKDIRALSTVKLRSLLGLVSQQPTLFSMSIEDNIKYGIHRPVSDEDVRQAAEQANAHAFISKFPEGYKTMVGERGVTLSGGERQRVAIARALLAQPKVLLLDEATSALDAESEHLVQEALDRVMVGKTTIVIAHRLSTVRNATCILVIQDGKIAERGTHQDLMKRDGGLYASLVARQLH